MQTAAIVGSAFFAYPKVTPRKINSSEIGPMMQAYTIISIDGDVIPAVCIKDSYADIQSGRKAPTRFIR